uniref:CS domain-containing protein n=1 Tax=Strigamia maritima TaxID=126957 RepID=T1IU68_STRMM
MEGDLSWKENVENSCWTLRPGQAVHVNLEKVQERWWDSLLIDEPKINIRNIDVSRPMNDLADDEQAKIHELMYNQQQQRLGKVTSQQMMCAWFRTK